MRLSGESARKARALRRLQVAPARKLVLRFRRRFWPDRLHFLHASDAPFPTFWSAAPVDAPVLTAWAGGPQAEALSGLRETAAVERALATLAGVASVPLRRLFALLEGWSGHDWQGDPFSRGAYSYLSVGGQGRDAGARPAGGRHRVLRRRGHGRGRHGHRERRAGHRKARGARGAPLTQRGLRAGR